MNTMDAEQSTPCLECRKLAELCMYIQDNGWHLHKHPRQEAMWQVAKKLKTGLQFFDVSSIDGYLLDRLKAIDASNKPNFTTSSFK
jgi:hypothetical protein